MSLERIVYNKGILGGKPVVKGTRISVQLILNLLSHGMGVEDILKEYPHLTRDDILACLEYASIVLENEEVVTTP